MVADGAAILAELDTKLLQKLYDRQIRISVSNLDLPPSLPGFVKEGVKGLVDAAVARFAGHAVGGVVGAAPSPRICPTPSNNTGLRFSAVQFL